MYSRDLRKRRTWRCVVRCSVYTCTDADASQTLIDENHRLLDQLHVSHPSLEAVRRITGADAYNLATKLTGAGGGGCAVTLIPEGECSVSFPCSCFVPAVQAAIPSSNHVSPVLMAISFTDFSSSKLTSLISALESEKFTSETFRTYLTEVGGLGLGILSQPADASDLPTPPSDTLETTFTNTSTAELRGWAEALGKWAYV